MNTSVQSHIPTAPRKGAPSTAMLPLSSSVKEKLRFTLNGVFESAIENDICYKNPMKRIALPQYQKVIEKHVYSLAEQRLIIDYIKKHNCDKEIAILLKTGIRRGELLALIWDDIDLSNMTLSVNKAIKDTTGKPVVGPPKTATSNRIVLFDEELCLLLKSIKRSVEFNKKGNHYFFDSQYVVHTKHGEMWQPNNWASRRYKPLMNQISEYYRDKDILIPILSPHELRHSFGTGLYDKGVDIRTIQKTMGHADMNITSNLYVHDNIETMRKALKY